MSKTNITVRFSDIDMAGNVHNSKYLSYFEQARIDFLTQISGLNWDWRMQGLLIGRIEVDYIHPLHLRDKVFIKTSCDHVGNKVLRSHILYLKKLRMKNYCVHVVEVFLFV